MNYTVAELAEALHVDPQHIRQWIRNNGLRAAGDHHGKKKQISSEEVSRFLRDPSNTSLFVYTSGERAGQWKVDFSAFSGDFLNNPGLLSYLQAKLKGDTGLHFNASGSPKPISASLEEADRAMIASIRSGKRLDGDELYYVQIRLPALRKKKERMEKEMKKLDNLIHLLEDASEQFG